MEQNEKYIGKTFDNRYTIKKLIGSGGMSLVFLAYDEAMKRNVAVKVLRDELLNDHDAVERFCNEAKAVLMLSHDNIVKCYDFSNGKELKYIVMEYIEGETLKSLIKRKTRLSSAEAIDISIKILSALSHAHSKNIIHRDIKPQNILLPYNGGLKITDFGIAKIPSSDPLSVSCTTVGTVDYISPEQARGKTIDQRSDIYSLGIMLYEMVTGRLPFSGNNPLETAYMQIGNTAEPPSAVNPNVSKGLEQIIVKAIKKDPSERFDSAKQMLDCLVRLKENPGATFDFLPVNYQNIQIKSSNSDDLLFTGSYVQNTVEGSSVNDTDNKKLKKNRKKNKKVIIKTETVKKHSRISLASILLGVLCALGIIGLTAFLFVYESYFATIITSGDSEVIVVDDFEGQIYDDELKNDLEKAGYSVSVEWVSDSDHIYGTVISQSPRKNSRRKIIKGETSCELKLTVSLGENTVLLDNYVGLEYRYASFIFSEKNISVNFVKVYSDSMPQGRIVSTYPEGGSRISKDTTVIVYVSKGPDISYTIVPKLVGKTIKEAAQELINAGLCAGTVTYEYSDTVSAGIIISQSVYRGEAVPADLTTIDLVVSLGPEHPVTTYAPETEIPTTGDVTSPETSEITAPITSETTPSTDETITTSDQNPITEPDIIG